MTHHPKRIKKVCCFLKRLEKKICQIKSLCFFSEITHHRNDTRSRAENSPAQGNLQEAHHFFDENWAVIARLEPHSKQSHEKWQVHPAPRAPRLRAAAAVTFRQSLCVPRTQGAWTDHRSSIWNFRLCWWFLWVFVFFWTNTCKIFLGRTAEILPLFPFWQSFLQDHLAVIRSSTVRVVSITKSFETYISKLQWGISVSRSQMVQTGPIHKMWKHLQLLFGQRIPLSHCLVTQKMNKIRHLNFWLEVSTSNDSTT